MHVTIRTYAPAGLLVDTVVENEPAVRALLSGIDGFRAYYMLRTPDGGAISISVYDDAVGTDASNVAAEGWVKEHVPGLAFGAPIQTGGEVALSF